MSAAADIVFYKDILSQSLKDPDFCFKVCSTNFRSEHFPRKYMQFVFRIIKNFIMNPKYKGKLPTLAVFKDKIAVDSKIEDSLKDMYLEKVRDLFKRKIQNSEYGFEAVENLIVKSEMRIVLEDSINNLDRSEDPKAVVQSLINKSFKLSETDEVQIIDLFATYKDRQKLRLEMKSNPKKYKRFKFGIPSVDFCLPGGMMQGMIGSIAAKTGIGKSITVTHLGAHAVEQGLNVTHITSENENFQTTGRYDSRITSLKYNDIQLANLTDEEKLIYNKVYRKLNKKHANKIMIAKCKPNKFNCATILQILNKLESKHNHKTEVLIIDSPDLMQSVYNTKDIRIQHKKVYEEIKELTDSNRLITIVTTQLKSSSKDDDPTSEDLSESYDKSRLADIIILITQDKTQKANREATLAFVKNRDGARPDTFATIVLQFEKMTFFEKPPEEDDDEKPKKKKKGDPKLKVIEGGKKDDGLDSLRKISIKKKVLKMPTKGVKKIKKKKDDE